jgi:hypothetical protein
MSRTYDFVSIFTTEAERQQAVTALGLLRQAWDRAGALHVNVWPCAVPVRDLWAAGVDNVVLCGLQLLRCIDHRWERSEHRRGERPFERLGPGKISGRSCFVLTRQGRSFIDDMIAGEPTGLDGRLLGQEMGGTQPRPNYVREDRVLLWQGRLVKQFPRQPAQNQVLVLTAWEEQQFRSPLLDPLPRSDGVDPRKRFHDTIKALNHNQVNPLLRFRGNGTVEGAIWEPRERN